jgi:iron complex transport system substrate-binding protein
VIRAGVALLLMAALSLGDGAAVAQAVPRPVAKPLRVMSLNLCTDQLVLALLPPQRIASVNERSRDRGGSLMAAAARRVAINHGLAEEVLRARPDLVLAGSFTTPATRALLKRLGWPLVEVGPADTIAQIRATTRQVAQAVGEAARGEQLLARMDAQLAELARHPGPKLRVAAWDGSGFAAGPGSLYDTVLRLAGAVNVAADPRLTRTGTPDTELLLAEAPALLIHGGGDDRDGLRADVAGNPLVRRFWGADRTVTIDQAYYVCGTPFVADEALRLRARLQAAATAARTPLPFAPVHLPRTNQTSFVILTKVRIHSAQPSAGRPNLRTCLSKRQRRKVLPVLARMDADFRQHDEANAIALPGGKGTLARIQGDVLE